MKKLFILFDFLFIPIIVLLFVQCSESTTDPNDQALALYSQGVGEVSVGNNLSFPAFLADGYQLPALPEIDEGEEIPMYTTPYNLSCLDESSAEECWYAQKVEGNIWRADYVSTSNGTQNVTFIDWGDNIESVNAKVDRPFRLEVTLYTNVASDQLYGYEMAVLANPSSKDEIQGTNGVEYKSQWATVASPLAKIVVQKYNPESTLTWNSDAGNWSGAEDPESGFGFGVELNVGGKLIFGASQGGWVPDEVGNYRITFYMPGSEVDLSGASVGNYGGNVEDYTPSESLNKPEVDQTNNLTYVDMVVAEAGGGGAGGGAGGKKK